jgi:hypothetical protein
MMGMEVCKHEWLLIQWNDGLNFQCRSCGQVTDLVNIEYNDIWNKNTSLQQQLTTAQENEARIRQAYCAECDYDPEICRGTHPDMQCAVRSIYPGLADCCEKQYQDIIQMLKKRADRANVMSQSYAKGPNWDAIERELKSAIEGIEKVHAMGWLGKGV